MLNRHVPSFSASTVSVGEEGADSRAVQSGHRRRRPSKIGAPPAFVVGLHDMQLEEGQVAQVAGTTAHSQFVIF